jgi:hypothetical protein
MHETAAALCLGALLAASSSAAQIPGGPIGILPPSSAGTTSPPPSAGVPKAGAPAGRAEPAPSKAPLPRGAVLEEVSGLVQEVDRKTFKLTIESVSGPVTLSLDRNTMVYTSTGLGTVLDLAPGQQIRAGRNADYLAYWVQLRASAKTEPGPTPAQGTGPAPAQGTGPAGTAAAPATEGSGKGPGTTPTSPAAPGAAPPVP